MARTTMRQYRNTEKSIQEIARELNVESVIEGSVRYADDQVRVTIQLIEAETGTHLWSDTYDREFKDIFAIESDIAMNVANALKTEFSLEEQARIEEIPTSSTAAYNLYLKSLNTSGGLLAGGRFGGGWQDAIDNLDRAIQLDPKFALAYVRKAQLHTGGGGTLQPEVRAERRNIALENLEKALQLNPDLPQAHLGLARVYYNQWRMNEAGDAVEIALLLGPDLSGALNFLALLSSWLGNVDEARQYVQQANLLGVTPHGKGVFHILVGDLDSAAASFRDSLEQDPSFTNSMVELSRVVTAMGDKQQALEYLRDAEEYAVNPGANGIAVLAHAYGLAGSRADASRLQGEMEQFEKDGGFVGPMHRVLVSLAVGDQEEALRWLNEIIDNKDQNPPHTELSYIFANSFLDPVLEEPEFVEVRSRMRAE